MCERERTVASARAIGACQALDGEPRAHASDPVDAAVGHAMKAVGNDTDRGILWMRLLDRPHAQIAESIGSTPAAVRMRWGRIKERLRSMPRAGGS